jgi:hypothetical protein
MILYSEIDDISTEEVTEETSENEILYDEATQGDAIRLVVSQEELNKAVETLPKIYDLFCFWLLLWLLLTLLPRIRKQLQRHTGEMERKK